MLFDNTAPSTTFWTPPRRATGFDKTKMALFGYNADGTQNTWGKISSWIPGANVMANRSAEKIASQAGLTEVDNAINADLDNRLTKLQTMLSAGKAVAGVAMANPALIASGVQGVTQDVAALAQAQDPYQPLQGTTSYRRFAKGGKVEEKPDDPGKRPTPKESVDKGADFIKEWYLMRAMSGKGGLTPNDIGVAADLQYPVVLGKEEFNKAYGKPTYDHVAGFYRGNQVKPGVFRGKTYISDAESDPEALASISAHEVNHQAQWEGLRSGSANPHPAWKQTEEAINNELKRAGKPRQNYFSEPREIHSRLMQIRQDAGFKPDEVITPERFRNYVNYPKNGFRTQIEESARLDLMQLLDEQGIINLLNKTVYNDRPQKKGVLYAKDGGKVYADSDKTEDIDMIDKRTGQKVGEMRYGERIFDQKATLQIEKLADSGNASALGKFLMAELATHPDRQSGTMQFFAGGGKPSYAPIKPLSSKTTGAKDLLEATKNRAVPTTNQINQAAANLFKPSDPTDAPDWIGMGSDVLRGITAAIGAAQPLPTRPVNPNLLQMQRELADRQNEGLSAGERVNLLRQKAATQAADIQAIRDSVGGGGSASAVLAAVNRADQNANAFGQQMEAADRSQRAINKDAYYRDLQATQAGSDALFAQQYNTALNNKNAFTQAMMANLQNMADRSQYNDSYGDSSPYYKLMTQLMKRTNKNFEAADAPVTSLTPPAI